jgi:hydroxymethylbilane synthase
MKDVPSEIPSGLILAATTKRLEPHDVLITRNGEKLDELPQGGVLATGSLRRRSQALVARRDLAVVDLRGNVPTRLRKFEESSWDAMILAKAGLERLGLKPKHVAKIATEQMLPAVGQGALALEARSEDEEVLDHLRRLQHAETAAAVAAERGFLRELEGGCQVPIASMGLVHDDRLVLEGFIGALDGSRHVRRKSDGPVSDASEIGTSLAKRILREGGKEILDEVRKQ